MQTMTVFLVGDRGSTSSLQSSIPSDFGIAVP